MNPFTMESQIPGQRPERLLPDQFWMYSYKVRPGQCVRARSRLPRCLAEPGAPADGWSQPGDSHPVYALSARAQVAMCPLKHSHDWEKCIYAHEGEKARRRPVHKYQAIQCPEARAVRA